MAGPVMDPELLAQLEGDASPPAAKPVTDPGLIRLLEEADQLVEIPGVGTVSFPAEWSDEEVGAAAREIYDHEVGNPGASGPVDRSLLPRARRLAANRKMVAEMPWPVRQVTAFGEHARHAIRQGANLLGKLGVPDSPTDEQLREESEALEALRDGAPVASFLGGAAITAPPVVASGSAIAPAGASLGAVVGTGAALGAAEGAVFSDPGKRLPSAVGGGLTGGALPLATGLTSALLPKPCAEGHSIV